MSDASQIYLPPELVHAIVVRMEDRDAKCKPVKYGLASCSLTYRHWARRIRPMLFRELAIRSATDISQLLAFLDGHNFLDRDLGDCIECLDIIDERTSSNIPWSHQTFRIGRRIPALKNVTLTIKSSGTDDQLHPGRCSLQPFAIIPRTLPGSITRLSSLTLSNLRLPSVKSLANYVEHLHVTTIKLDAVTFRTEEVPDIRRRRPHSYSKLSCVTASDCFHDIAGLQRWFKIANVLYACQGRLKLDDVTLALAENCMVILLSHSTCRDEAKHLQLTFYPWSLDQGEISSYTR